MKLRLGEAGARGAEEDPTSHDAIGFNLGGTALPVGTRLDAAFQLAIDTWNGAERLQLKLKGVKAPGGDSRRNEGLDAGEPGSARGSTG